jgi:hypothetical protein
MDEEEQSEPMSPILKYFLIFAGVILVLALFVVFAIRAGHPTANIINGTTVSKNVECKLTHRIPDPECTPGIVLAVPAVGLCSSDYPPSMIIGDVIALNVYRRYGITDMNNWTITTLVPVMLGGSVDEENLYPLSDDYPGYNERVKATLALREQVCNQAMPIEVARDIIKNSWQDKPTLYE